MKISLINPPWYSPDDMTHWGVRAGSRWPHFQPRPDDGSLPRYIPFPFFLAVAARILQQDGHDVQLVDAVAEGLTYDQLYARVGEFSPDVIFYETSTPSLKSDRQVFKTLRDNHPHAMQMASGTHDAGLAKELLREPVLLDAWLPGEYEYALRDAMRALAAEESLDGIPGVMTAASEPKEYGTVEDLNSLPMPFYDELPMSNYSDPVCGLPFPTAQTWISRGCPYGCTFCVWPQLVYGNRQYRLRRIEKALSEVQTLVEQYGCESFYFDDDTTNIGEDRMIELAAMVRQRGLNAFPWAMMARADCMTPKMIDELAAAGMYSVKYGVETISKKLMNACRKNTRLDRFYDAIRHTRQAGIKMHLTFTFGIPGETRETIRETMAFALEAAPETAQFSLCTPFPGTAFYDECQTQRWLVTDDWSQYLGSDRAVVSTPSLSADALEEEYQAALGQWQAFVEQRTEARRQSLLEKLQHKVAQGARWCLLGDEHMASFLKSDDLTRKRVWDERRADVTVIVSRHDEEKIWRHLRRREPRRADQALRLYRG